MFNENETDSSYEDNNTIEEKRRKNVIDNQKFLESLKLFNVRDELKSTVNSVTTVNKPTRKRYTRKEKIDQSEIRRSSRIQSMPQASYDNQFVQEDKTIHLSTDESSNEEDEDTLTLAFTNKIDKDWEPLHKEKLVNIKHSRPVRKAIKTESGGVKIFLPNIGLKASTIISKDNIHKSYVSKKINVAISSSSEED